MILKYFVTLLLLHLVLTVFGACQEKQRRPNKFLIPQDYTGWVRINYKVKNAAPIPIEDGFYLVKFTRTGLVDTSSEGEEGWAGDEYYYYSEGTLTRLPEVGKSKMIWGEVGYGSKQVPDELPTQYAEFFVGPEQQFKEMGLKCIDNDLNPVVGPIENCLKKIRDRTPADKP